MKTLCLLLIFQSLLYVKLQSTTDRICAAGRWYNEEDQRCVNCPLGRFKPFSGDSMCIRCKTPPGYPDSTTLRQGAVNQSECVPTPFILSFNPLFGPTAGGTPIKVIIKYQEKLEIVNITAAGKKCTTNHSLVPANIKNDTVICLTSPSDGMLLNGPVTVTFSNQYMTSSDNQNFFYRRNPKITAVEDRRTIISGGLNLIVRGKNLGAVSRPILEVTRVHKGVPVVFPTLCRAYNNTIMRCPTPYLAADLSTHLKNMKNYHIVKRSTDYLLEHLTQYYIGFHLDGYHKYTNISRVLPGQGRLKVVQDPSPQPFEGDIKDIYPDEKVLRIKGDSLNLAAKESDYTITIGRELCVISLLATNEIQCRQPWPQPEGDDTGYGPGKIPRVTVSVGMLKIVLGYLRYNNSRPNNTAAIVGAVLGVLVTLVIIGIVAFFFCIRYRRKKKSSGTGLNEFVVSPNSGAVSGSASRRIMQARGAGDPRISIISNNSGSGIPLIDALRRPSATGSTSTNFSDLFGLPGTPLSIQSLPFDLMLEMDEDLRLTLDETTIDSDRLEIKEVIGQGYFGQVYKGILTDEARQNPKTVAVKTIQGKYGITIEDVKSFLQEAIVMKDFNHPHVLSLLGVILRENKPYVILHYMEYGDLRSYISAPEKRIKVRELVAFSVQIAGGMEYLSSQKFVHRDLATRNCMINKSMIIKIADFGLSRDIYKMDYYRVEDKHRPLPVKWMAIESLTSGIFSTKSDVWSFGVVMWELLTRGASPYPDVDTFNIKNYIVSGRRLHQPEFSPDEVFAIMCSCWREKPEDRPTFTELAATLHDVVNNKKTESHPDYLQLI